MYSSDTDSDEAPLIINSTRHLVGKPAHEDPTPQPPQVPAQVDAAPGLNRECVDLPEVYVERCAVLIDFMTLFADQDTPALEENPVVEGFARLVRYPFCGGALAFGDRLVAVAPQLDVRGKKRQEKSVFMSTLNSVVKNVHGVAPNVVGADARPDWRDYYTILDAVALQQKTSRTNVCIPAASHDVKAATLRMQAMLSNVLEQAMQCCRSERVDPAVAFLIPESRRTEVQRALAWFQRCCKVEFPPYRLFSLQEVAGEEWEALLRSRFSSFGFSRHCPLHSVTALNEFGYPFHCCMGTVLDLHRVVIQAAEAVQLAIDEESYRAGSSPPAPVMESDE